MNGVDEGAIPPFLTGCIRRTCAAIFSVRAGGGDAADAHVRTVVGGGPSPFLGVVCGLRKGIEDDPVQPFIGSIPSGVPDLWVRLEVTSCIWSCNRVCTPLAVAHQNKHRMEVREPKGVSRIKDLDDLTGQHRWPDNLSARIVAKRRKPGPRICDVAARCGSIPGKFLNSHGLGAQGLDLARTGLTLRERKAAPWRRGLAGCQR